MNPGANRLEVIERLETASLPAGKTLTGKVNGEHFLPPQQTLRGL